MIVPNGRPAWSRTASAESYGGDLNKVNYQSIGATNPLTDVTAEQHARLTEDVAPITRVAGFATLTIQCDDTTPGPPTVQACDLMTGVQLTSYIGNNPPTGFPTVARVGNGYARVTFASSYTDSYSVAETLVIRHAIASPIGTTAQAEGVTITGNVVDVRIWDLPAGTAAANAKFTLEVGA